MSVKQLDEFDLTELQAKAKERTVKTQTIEYDLETLLKRIRSGYIRIDPSYQRRHRWKNGTSSRLIESLLLNIPIPTIYISQDIDIDDADDDSPVFTVIDGQQRLTAIRDFLENNLELTELEVLDTLNGMKYEDLPRFLKRRLQDRSLSCLRIDSTVDQQVKYDIFERLNSGSVELTAQELRNATYRSPFNEMIKTLSEDERFKRLANVSENKQNKMEDVELILRFYALTEGRYQNYKPNMKDFLNDSMYEFSKLAEEELGPYRERFIHEFEVIEKVLGGCPFARWKKDGSGLASRFNTAVYDAVIVACDTNQPFSPTASSALRELFNEESFQESISGSMNDTNKLFTRIGAVKRAVLDGD